MRLTIMLLAMLIAVKGNSQEQKEINFLDLDQSQLKENYGINKKVRVKINNINRFLYKVAVEKTDTDFNIKAPAILTGIKFPAFFTSQLAEVAHGAPSPQKRDAARAKTADALEKEMSKNIAELLKAQQFINNAVDTHNRIVHISKKCDEEFTAIRDEVVGVLTPFLKPTRNTSIPTLVNELEAGLENAMYTAEVQMSLIEEIFSEWNSVFLDEFRGGRYNQNEGLSILRMQLSDEQEKYKKLTKAADKAQSLQKIRDIERNIRGAESSIKFLEEDFENKKKLLGEKLAKAKELMAEIKKFKEEGKVFTLTDNIRKVNESNYTYYSERVTMKKDEVAFKFTATAEGQLTCDRPNEEKFTVTLNTKGGFKIDFSTGLFANFGSEDFLGREYYYDPVDEDSLVQIRAADGGKRSLISLGALMHVYWRFPWKVRPSAVVGASTTTSFDALNFHVGGALSFGRKDRICVSGGMTLREVNLLDRKYQLDYTYAKKLLPEAVPTIKKFPEVGGFVALTYNFSRIEK